VAACRASRRAEDRRSVAVPAGPAERGEPAAARRLPQRGHQEDASAFAFLERLAEEPGLRDIPVLAHTRDKLDSAQARLAKLRFGTQPLELLPSLDELRERITLHLSAAQPNHVPALIRESATESHARPSPQAGEHEALRERKILVIDDDPRNVFAITSTLELYGMTVTQAADGRKGIEALLSAEDTDLILMDVMMPELDGYATMTKIRQMPAFATLPIIAVTARAMPGDRRAGRHAAGHNGHRVMGDQELRAPRV